MIKSSDRFNKLCAAILEQMLASTVFGTGAQTDQGGAVPGSSDFYAPNDARIPKAIGTKRKKPKIQRRNLSFK